MGSAGLEWDANDNPEKARLNQKTRFVGTGTQINALSTTYAGQEAFCTSTGSGYTVDTNYVRNAANSAWVIKDTITRALSESSEANNTPVSDNAEFAPTAGHRYYVFFTLPTTETMYIFTKIDWKNGTAVAGNISCGVDILDAATPTIASTPLIASFQEVAQTGTSATQSNSVVISNPVRGGSFCGAWISCSSASARIRELTGGSTINRQKAMASYSLSSTPYASDSTAWTPSSAEKYLKIYYKGYA